MKKLFLQRSVHLNLRELIPVLHVDFADRRKTNLPHQRWKTKTQPTNKQNHQEKNENFGSL